MIVRFLKYILNKLEPQINEVVNTDYFGGFTKEKITKEEEKIYIKGKAVLAIELKKIKNDLLSLHTQLETSEGNATLIIQGGIKILRRNFTRLNFIVNPEQYIIKTKTK